MNEIVVHGCFVFLNIISAPNKWYSVTIKLIEKFYHAISLMYDIWFTIGLYRIWIELVDSNLIKFMSRSSFLIKYKSSINIFWLNCDRLIQKWVLSTCKFYQTYQLILKEIYINRLNNFLWFILSYYRKKNYDIQYFVFI
jgi:hypothetical protein